MLADREDDLQVVTSGTAFRSRFTGKERDTETGGIDGNDYFGARYYASSMGRFLSPDSNDDEDDPDPVPYADPENPQSLNLYAYVQNNPLGATDSDGHSPCANITILVTPDGSSMSQSFDCQTYQPPSFFDERFHDSLMQAWQKAHQAASQVSNWAQQQRWIPTALGGVPAAPAPTNWKVGPISYGMIPWGMTGGLSGAVPGFARMRLLSLVQDAKLRNIVNELFKATSSFGNGGTADAIAYERATGQAIGGTFHTMKGQQFSAALMKAINSGRLSVQDSQIAQWLYDDLQAALTYAGR
jgi:RHS repeat-associated protein